jgi:hypothetical protein
VTRARAACRKEEQEAVDAKAEAKLAMEHAVQAKSDAARERKEAVEARVIALKELAEAEEAYKVAKKEMAECVAAKVRSAFHESLSLQVTGLRRVAASGWHEWYRRLHLRNGGKQRKRRRSRFRRGRRLTRRGRSPWCGPLFTVWCLPALGVMLG